MKHVDVYLQCEDGAVPPAYATDHAAGVDLRTVCEVTIEPGQTVLIHTGLRLAMPPGVEAQVRPRSGLSLRTDLRLPNSPGTIDADYRDELCILAHNTASLTDPTAYLLRHPECVDETRTIPLRRYFADRTGRELPDGVGDGPLLLDAKGYPVGTLYFKAGERIAQLVFSEILRADFILTDEVRSIGKDRGGGFGSTGTK